MTEKASREVGEVEVTATYRVQLQPGFGFSAATRIVDYLADLGISHAYASPYLRAEHGSTHGYDLVDPAHLNPELGNDAEFDAWTDALAGRGMAHIVDVVPNHMAATTDNAWWFDVLENGPASMFAEYFDIEWHPPKAALADKVLLPVLGAQYGEVLERGELRLERAGGALFVRYYERRLPVEPKSVAPRLERAAASLGLPTDDPRRQDLESVATGLRHLPASTETAPEQRAERAREKEVLKRRLATLCEDPLVARAVDAEIEATSHDVDALDRLLVEQCYRLAYWRVASEEINYRRFFDINDLAALRMESDAVFADAHALLLRLVEQGRLQGLRLDHTDGLYDPAAYFDKLRAALAARTTRRIYVIAEKILSTRETLPRDWAIDGTTGYDFLALSSALFVDRRAEAPLTQLYQQVTGDTLTFTAHAHRAKRAIMRSTLASEVTMLAQRLERIATRDRRSRDFTLSVLRRAISETIAAFPVYRTYVRPDGSREPTDEQIVLRAIRVAKRANPETSPSAFDFLRDVLLLAPRSVGSGPEPAPAGGPDVDGDRAARVEFAMRFQQLTGPVMAKGVEDTSFYTYVRFVALNEVGSDPDRFGVTIAELHEANAARLASRSRSMCATSTHDTKRGEDVRARLAVLSEIPRAWEGWSREWLALAARHARTIDDEPAPSTADQYLFLQTAIGAYPLDEEGKRAFSARLVAYAIKAAREAKRRTSWLSPNEAYEEALRSFCTSMLADHDFARSLADRADALATYGASNGLALTLLKCASPGVADTYQGSESWDLRLVDPDNRSIIDYEALRARLSATEGARTEDLLACFRDGRIKLHVLRTALRLRRAMPDLFVRGAYTPIDAGEDVVAFTRHHANASAVCAVTRHPHRVTGGRVPWAIGDVWQDRVLSLPEGRFHDVLSGRVHDIDRRGLSVAQLFRKLPVALLVSA